MKQELTFDFRLQSLEISTFRLISSPFASPRVILKGYAIFRLPKLSPKWSGHLSDYAVPWKIVEFVSL